MLLATVATTFAAEKTVWEGSQQISWNTDYFPGIQVDTYNEEGFQTIFTGLAKDDIIRLYTTTEYDSPQYALKYKTGDNWDWTDLEFTNTGGVLSFTVASDDMATWIAERGLVITGQAYTLTKITIETPSGEEGSTETDLSVQEGSSPLPLTLLSDWSAYTTFAASQFANAKAGDVITVYVKDVEEGAQISLKDMSDGWPALDESTQYPSVATTDTKFAYTLTEESVAKVKAYGLVIGGQKLTVTRVTLTTTSSVDPDPEPTEGVTYTAWTGETVFGNTWSVWQQVEASAFANAKENMILRVKFKDLKAGAQLQMSDGSWTVLPDVEVVNISGVYQDYTITAERLAVLQAKGLIVSGTNFTLTSVEVINPADLKPLTLSVPVTNNWVYSGAPSFTIHVENPYDEIVTANAVIAIATDKLAPVTTITKSVDVAANGTEDMVMTFTETLAAGIYHATATVNDDMARSFFFAVNPTSIVSAPDSQSDFDSYWTAAREQLTAIEATDEPILTEIPSKSTDKRKVYLVEFKSIPDGTSGEPVTVRGYYAEPTDGLRHPVIMHYLGYDSGYRPGGQDVKPYCPSGDGDTSDYAEFYLSARGQSINNRAANEREADGKGDFTNTYGDWFAFNFGQKDSYYYRGAYMDQVRAIDFMATRKTSDMDNLFAEGQSQGGAFTVAAAALSGYTFKAIAPAITFMGDFPDYFDIVNWPAYVARENQGTMTDAEMFAFLSYYDTKNLATKISCPVITSVGLQDNVCPAHTNLAPYNNVTTATSDKQIVFNPELQHQVASDWFTTYMTFFKKYQTESVQTYTLTTTVSPEGSGVITVKKGDVATTETEFDYGTELTLTATPNNDDLAFKQWVIGETVVTDNPYTFKMTGDITITAEFKSADPNVIWLGTTPIDWYTGASQSITVSADDNLKIADCLVMSITPSVEGIDWPQVQMSSLNGWGVLVGSSNIAIDTNTKEVRFNVTKQMLADITANSGFGISGVGFTLNKVKIERGDSEGYENAIWIGEKVFGSNWSVYQTIGKACFADATAGQVLRMKYKDVMSGPAMNLSYTIYDTTTEQTNWSALPGTTTITPSGFSTKLVLTEEMLTAIRTASDIEGHSGLGDLHISGVNFTLTSVDLLDASDVKDLTCSVPVTGDDWVWNTGETPTFTVNVQNDHAEAVTAKATLMLATDKMVAIKNYEASKEVAAGGSEAINFDITETLTPGFYHVTMIVNDETVRAFNFGYAPTEISSPADKQVDFESFWQTAKDELAAIEATDKPVLTKIESRSTNKRTVYLVEFKSVSDGDGQPVTVRGYYAEPTDGKKHPVIMHYQGYDSGYRPGGQGVEPWCLSGDTDELSANYAEFILSTRGQSVNNRPASERADGIQRDFENTYGDWFAFNFGDKDKYYYRGAYMDVVRAIDFMATRPTSDMTNLYAEGQSQGGAFSYAAAALSGREFKAIAPGIAFMGDFPDYFELASWPASVARENQGTMTDAEMYAFLSYFDTKNLATLISNKTAVIATIGVQDNVCPPHTNIAPYNNLAEGTTKEISFNPENAHQVADNWYEVYMNYFASKYVEPEPEPEPEPGEKTRTENAQKLFDVLTSLYGNKIISGTTAVVDWNTNQAEQVHQWTNKYPAINTYDFINIHASKDVNPDGWLDYSDISGVKNWAAEGGVVSAMWHWQVKNNAGTGYTCTPGTGDAATSFDASKVYVDGTAENTLAKQQLSQVCGYLKKMQDAGIPVIWRPFHEAAGNTYEFDGGTAWFWWGAKGADVYKQLWQWMYNYMVNEQGLHNLIWVWTSQTKDDSWYPGNDYVDIVGRDSYGGQAAQQKSDFDHLTAGYPNMMVALSECGNTSTASQSDISAVWESGAKWSWFSTWYDAAGSQLHNTQNWWTNAFSQDYVVTRDQMKELLDLNIEPDPEPQPEPATNTFDENGVADLSKIEVQNAEKVTYDVETHTVTTTEGWTGVQLTVADGEQVSGKELRITFDRAMKVKCYVKYTNETDAEVIMDDAAEILYFELDNTKKLYQVQIQPTEAATFAFQEIKVNPESTKPVLKPLEEGEVRTLFEDEEGVVMAWNEICQMDAEWGAILETGESFLVTVKSRTEGSEWPKVILRDASSAAVIEVELAEVSSYPYIVKMILTDDVVAKLRNGFRFSGDGITITKIEITKPAPVKEGDVSIDAMNWFRNATYDAATHTGSTSSRWGQFGWQIGDERYADKTLVIVSIEETAFPVTLKMEYTNTDGKSMATSMGVAAGKTQLNLPLPLDTKVIKKVYLTYADAADVVLTDAAVIAGANARPLTGYEDDGTTAVEEAIVNVLTKHNTHHIYDLQGRKVSQPVKGLYIVDGRKIVIR